MKLPELAQFDCDIRSKGHASIAGVDEAGRGPLAGPVVAAACILPDDFSLDAINDSKKLTAKEREEIYFILTSNKEIRFGIGISTPEQIDTKNILQATFDAMHQAIDALTPPPDYLLIDGKFIPTTSIPAEGVVKGDSKSQCIAAASILAKYTRDALMDTLHKEWPQYGFESHKGYGTAEHLSAINKYGAIPKTHRMTFDPIRSLLLPDLFDEPLQISKEENQ